jgi:hypothetical protein
MLACTCSGWEKSANQIFGLQLTESLRNNSEYTGEPFKFCPWCATSLTHKNGCTGCKYYNGRAPKCSLPSLTPCPELMRKENNE